MEEKATESKGESPEEITGKTSKKRSGASRFFLGLLKVCCFLVLYLVVGAAAVGGGVGWHYLDANNDYDLSKVEELAAGAEVVDAHGRHIGRIGATDRKLIKREDIPPVFIDALLAAEDQRFFFHPGFDPAGTMRAAIANYRAESIQEGGSTLTQQLARDVYGLEGRHIERKLNEIALAFWIEREYSKDEILVHYLNRIYFGSGFYGVGAAAKGYFDKALSDLTVDESAMLCGLIRSPSRFSPFVSQKLATANRNQTLQRMVSIGRLSREEMDLLIAQPTAVANNRDQRIFRGQASFLLKRMEKETRELIGDRSLEGLTIHSSVDLEFQQAAAFEIDRHLKNLHREKPDVDGIEELEGAAVVVHNKTGRLLLTVGSRDFHGSEYDRSREMKRPSGSAFIPFVYAAAFESGSYDPSSILTDAPFDNREMGLGGMSGVLGEWSTENPENRWEGPITAARALQLSKNSPTARLGLEIGLKRVSDLIAKAGIQTPVRELSGSLLGASEMSLSELVRAYTIFPNRGVPAPRIGLIESISFGEETVFSSGWKVETERAISEETAALISSLIGNEQSGTTPAFTDGWHFGFNEEYTWGVWVGKDTFETIYPLAFGGETAGPIVDALLESASLERGQAGEQVTASNPAPVASEPEMKRKASVQPATTALIGADPYGTLGLK
ncbi:MAG: transglycosylase domain-containing protein [Verrucomicrobiales bacterium]|nr:transglycosylase domain-containing protein [Verrucomicrobiales bacterium]